MLPKSFKKMYTNYIFNAFRNSFIFFAILKFLLIPLLLQCNATFFVALESQTTPHTHHLVGTYVSRGIEKISLKCNFSNFLYTFIFQNSFGAAVPPPPPSAAQQQKSAIERQREMARRQREQRAGVNLAYQSNTLQSIERRFG